MCDIFYNELNFAQMNKCEDIKGFYKTLNINNYRSSFDDIKRNYRNLARKYHPDKEHGDSEKFKKIQCAYDILSDKEKRSLYDANVDGDNHDQFEQTFVFDMQDVFKNFFGNQSSRHENVFHYGGVDVTPPTKRIINLRLDDVVFGCNKDISFDKPFKCSKCGPDGKTHSSLIQCLNCHGRGYIDSFTFPVICPSCNGESIIRTNLRNCVDCKGTSFFTKTVTISVPIASGMKHNSTFLLENERIIIELKHVFENVKIKGYNIHVNHNITIEDVLIGFSHRVKLSETEEPIELSRDMYFDISVPEIHSMRGVCKNGSIFDRGNIYIHYIVVGSKNPKKLHKFKRAFEKIFSTK
jgi:DnaJ-class molecular chaperone